MVPEHNPSGRNGAGSCEQVPGDGAEESISVVFDLDDPEQAESLERHRAAFGKGNAGVEPLADGRVVLRLSPGGAGRLP